MTRLLIKQLSLLALVIASATIVAAQPVDQQPGDQADQSGVQLIPLSPQGRSVYDQYTLGEPVDGAQIIYSYQYTQSFDSDQEEISLSFDYPTADDSVENSYTITQVTLYVEAGDGATTQAYVSKNGIGEHSISLQIIAKNSNSLRYMVVIYGKEM